MQPPRMFNKILTQGLSRGVIVLDRACRVLDWNYWMEKHSGIRTDKIIEQNLLEQYPDIQKRGKASYIRKCIEKKIPYLLSPLIHHYLIPIDVVRQDRHVRMFQNVKIYPLPEEEDDAAAMILIRDMTDAILHEKEIRRLSLLLEGIRDINKLMVRAESEAELIQSICEVLVEKIGYGFSWIGLTGDEGDSENHGRGAVPLPLTLRASATKTGHDPAKLKARWGDAEFRQGMLGRAIRTGNAEIFDWCEDVSVSETRWQRVCCRCACSLPLKTDEHLIGALDIHCGQDILSSEEIKLLREVADDISFTIDALRDKARHRQARKEMRRIRQQHQARKMEAIGILAGGIAHDFNNLLTIIMGNIELAQYIIPPGDEADETLSAALSACGRASELTQKFLTLSKGGAPIMTKGSLGELIREMIPGRFTGTDIRCELSVPDDLWNAEFDTAQMGQVFDHIIANACEAMPRGGDIRILAENTVIGPTSEAPEVLLQEGRYVRLRFQDQGTGIAKEHLHSIFDPYFSTKEWGNQKGMGLGLTIVYSIIRNHDGGVRVKSAPSKGTCVHVWLPASETDMEERPHKHKENIPRATRPRILVMDDEDMILKLIRHMLKSLGYEVESVRNGPEVLARYEEALNSDRPFDAVILDLIFRGGMGGLEIMTQLKAIDPEVRAIVSSGYSDDPVMSNYEQYGFCDVLPKPYQKAELNEALKGIGLKMSDVKH